MDSGYINTYYRAGGSNPNGSTNYPSLQAFPSSSAGQAQTSGCTTTVLPVSGGSTNMGPMSLLSLNISHNPKPTLTNSHSQTNLSALTSSQLPLQVFRYNLIKHLQYTIASVWLWSFFFTLQWIKNQHKPGSWLLRISVVRFSVVRIFKKQPIYPAYAIFTT